MADVYGSSGAEAPKKTTQVGGQTSEGRLVTFKVLPDGTLCTTTAPFPEKEQTLTPTERADPGAAQMLPIEMTAREIVFEGWVEQANNATAVKLSLFIETRLGKKILPLPGATFDNLEVTPMLPYRLSIDGALIGAMYRGLGCRLDFQGGVAPVIIAKII